MSAKNLWQIFRATPKPSLLAWAACSAVVHVTLPLWMLYLAIVVFTDQAYGGLGILAALSTLIALAATVVAGRLVDRNHQRPVLKISAWIELLLGGLRLFVTGVPLAVVHNLAHQQSNAHTLVVFNWYYDQEADPVGRWAFFQMCAYFQALTQAVLLLAVIAGLLIFANTQLEVIRYACGLLGLLGLLILGLDSAGWGLAGKNKGSVDSPALN